MDSSSLKWKIVKTCMFVELHLAAVGMVITGVSLVVLALDFHTSLTCNQKFCHFFLFQPVMLQIFLMCLITFIVLLVLVNLESSAIERDTSIMWGKSEGLNQVLQIPLFTIVAEFADKVLDEDW